MRVREAKRRRKRALCLGVLVLLPVAVVVPLGAGALVMFQGMGEYMQACGPPDPSQFLAPDYAELAGMAGEYERLFEAHHLPLNMCVPITWDTTTPENFTRVARYHGDENDALIWTGTALAGQCFRYAAARRERNATERANALRVATRLLSGIEMCLAVPNGGLGPDHGAVVARYWGHPALREITPHLFAGDHDPTEETFFNGSGTYQDYRYSAHTSNDQHAGLYLGLGMAWEFLAPHEPAIRARVRRLVDQLCTNMLRNDFLVIDGNGGPNGADQKRQAIGGYQALVVLKLGAVALPDKFAAPYYHYLLTHDYLHTNEVDKTLESLTSYYAINFGSAGWLTLLLLEEDPGLRRELFTAFAGGLYETVQYHRNAWFDLIYLVTGNLSDALLQGSVTDQLMRFKINHFPDRHYETLELDTSVYTLVEGPRRYNDWLASSPLGGLYRAIFSEVGLEESKLHTDKPLTVEYRRTDLFMWQRSPFRYHPPAGNAPQAENPGLSFTVPYWLGRAFGYIAPGAGRSAEVVST